MSSRLKVKQQPVSIKAVSIEDTFWKRRMEANRTGSLPMLYATNKKSGALEGYQWKWDPTNPNHPWRIWLGDLTKWIEAASCSLMESPDLGLETMIRDAVGNVLKGQKPDGYLYANPIAPDKRWTNLCGDHELYDIGHSIEAAIAWEQASGDRRYLDAVCRSADLVDSVLGPEQGKEHGYPGHEEIELALVKLYRATGRERYLRLAKYFIDQRGQRPHYFDQEAVARGEDPSRTRSGSLGYKNLQAHLPVRQQTEAVGHSVRALYLYSGMIDVAVETGDQDLLSVCKQLWRSIAERRMFITGAVGSTRHREAFTFDYDLPNEGAYAETCAAIALVFFAHRMLQVEGEGRYADVMERALYNGALGGISLDGTSAFYTNPLAVYPDAVAAKAAHRPATFQSTRQRLDEWPTTACCLPNIARLIAQYPSYIYCTGQDEVFVNLYTRSNAELEVGDCPVRIEQETDYPWEGQVSIILRPEQVAAWVLALRIPDWCRNATLAVNDEELDIRTLTSAGYARIRRTWKSQDRVELTLAMPAERIEAHPFVRQDCGRIALQRGPMVYCLEEADNGKGLNNITLPRDAELAVQVDEALLGGVPVIVATGSRRVLTGWDGKLYRAAASERQAVTIKAVPYCMWENREPGEMLIWIREEQVGCGLV